MDVPITAKLALLQVLVRGPGYGLELVERVSDATGGRLKLRDGSVYPQLRDMEREGLVASYDGEPLEQRGGRPRRYYRLTAKGARAATQDRAIAAGLFALSPMGLR